MDMGSVEENEKKIEENKKNMKILLKGFPLTRAAIESSKKSMDILNSISNNLAESITGSMDMVSNLAKLYSDPMLLAFERGIKASDGIFRMRRELDKSIEGIAQTMLEFNEKMKQASPVFPSAEALMTIPNLNRFPDLYSGTLRATNAYIEALEKELEKEREEKVELLKIIEEMKKGSKKGYVV